MIQADLSHINDLYDKSIGGEFFPCNVLAVYAAVHARGWGMKRQALVHAIELATELDDTFGKVEELMSTAYEVPYKKAFVSILTKHHETHHLVPNDEDALRSIIEKVYVLGYTHIGLSVNIADSLGNYSQRYTLIELKEIIKKTT